MITVYPTYLMATDPPRASSSFDRASNLRAVDNSPRGYLSPDAARRLRRAANALIYKHVTSRSRGSKGRPVELRASVVTLTYPHIDGKPYTDDRHAKRYHLNALFAWLKRERPDALYVWKAEAQSSGALHFHLIVSVDCKALGLGRWWDSYLGSQGFPVKKQAGYEHSPASHITRIHARRELTAYLAKYMGKADKTRRPIAGRLMGYSDGLTEGTEFQVRCTKAIHSIIDHVKGWKAVQGEYYTIYLPPKSIGGYQIRERRYSKSADRFWTETSTFPELLSYIYNRWPPELE